MYPISNGVSSPTEDVSEDSKKTPRTPFQISGKVLSPDKPDKLNHDYVILGDVVGKTKETDRQQNGVSATSESDRGTNATNSASPTNLNFSVQSSDFPSKQQRIKMFAKKSLGSRPKLGSAGRKGSILTNKTTSLNYSVSSSFGNDEKLFSSSPQDVSIGVKQVVETTDMGDISHNYEAMDEDDKTTNPENKEADFEKSTMDKENFEEVQLMSNEDKLAKETASGVKCNNSTSLLDDTIPSGTAEVIEPREPISIGDVQLDELRVEDEKSKLNVGGRSPTEETTLINSSKMKSKQGKVGKAPRKKTEKTGKKPQLLAAGPHTEVHTIPDYKSEKENEPCNVGDKTTDLVEHCLAKPVCFILSGHRLQRKEFQKVIKHLKGRVCRDSHQWSYQATHFIAPDPVRRTEKFFSAAA